MAAVSITQHWADGNVTQLEVTTDGDAPNAVATALFGAVMLWRETCQAGSE